jgi:hypothetical protein
MTVKIPDRLSSSRQRDERRGSAWEVLSACHPSCLTPCGGARRAIPTVYLMHSGDQRMGVLGWIVFGLVGGAAKALCSGETQVGSASPRLSALSAP